MIQLLYLGIPLKLAGATYPSAQKSSLVGWLVVGCFVVHVSNVGAIFNCKLGAQRGGVTYEPSL